MWLTNCRTCAPAELIPVATGSRGGRCRLRPLSDALRAGSRQPHLGKVVRWQRQQPAHLLDLQIGSRAPAGAGPGGPPRQVLVHRSSTTDAPGGLLQITATSSDDDDDDG